MLDLTNQNHKRGVMILSSKDVRTVDKSLFDYHVNVDCLDIYVGTVMNRINDLDIDPSIKKATLSDLGYVREHMAAANKCLDKARDVFR